MTKKSVREMLEDFGEEWNAVSISTDDVKIIEDRQTDILDKVEADLKSLVVMGEEELAKVQAETTCPKCGTKKCYIGVTEAKAIHQEQLKRWEEE